MPIIFKRKISKFGGSYRVTIPKEIVEALQLKEGDLLNITLDNGKIIMEKPKD